MEKELGIEGVKLDEEKDLIIVEDPSKLTKEDKEKLFQLHVLFNVKDLNMEAIKNMVMELKGNIFWYIYIPSTITIHTLNICIKSEI